MKPKIRRKNAARRIGPGGPGIRLHEKVHLSKQKGKGPKPPTVTQREIVRQSLKKAGLRKTKMQKRSERATMTKFLGYKPPRLSTVVRKPSRYTVKGKRLIYKVEKGMKPGEMVARKGMFGDIKRDVWGNIIYDHGPDREVVTGKKLVGEGLVVKRLSKKRQRRKSSPRGTGATILGSAVARRGQAKKSRLKKKKRKGQKAKKEKRKKRK